MILSALTALSVLPALSAPAAAQEWLLPDARPMGEGEIRAALGGGTMTWALPERPNPAADTSDTDGFFSLRAAWAPVDRLTLDLLVGVGPSSAAVHPIAAVRYNLLQRDRMAVGLWGGLSWFSRGLPPTYASVEYTLLGLALDMGGARVRFDGSFPLLSGSYPPWGGLTGWGVLGPSGLGLSEWGVSWLSARHSVRLGLLSSLTTLDYRISFSAGDRPARWTVGVGAGYDAIGRALGLDPYPTVFRVEAGLGVPGRS